jgi:NADH:ubiquinone oxidoreductase subunit F (NADH-binding)/NADH:ubiquinone oxidoreductase subunit E
MEPRKLTPASGRRGALFQPRGRDLDPAERDAVVALVGEGPYDRALLIEYLHIIQDAEGCLPAGHLHGLADLLRISMAEVYEVATFYAHFDVVLDGEPRPPRVTVRICESLSCQMAGARDLIAELDAMGLADARIVPSPCMGACDVAPACQVNRKELGNATVGDIANAVKRAASGAAPEINVPPLGRFDSDDFSVLHACQRGDLSADAVIAALSDSGLRGLGGAGFPTGRKWALVRQQPGPRALAVNADEGEPGTFKDRDFLETRTAQFLEGVLIAAWTVEAEDTYIYLRDEYPIALEVLKRAIAQVARMGLASHTRLQLRRGAGAYICGEESAMIESIEGKRAWPRHRPPYLAQVGVFGRPTLVNNVETLSWVPTILAERLLSNRETDGDAISAFTMRSYSVSGRVASPGIVQAPAGTTVRTLIERCGGMASGHIFKGYLPGGASGGILPARLGDLPLDFGALEDHGCFVGSHAVIVLSDQDDMRDVVRNLMAFFAHESCGQCTPCRNGTDKAVRLIGGGAWDTGLLGDLADVMRDASICGLGQAAANPFMTALRYFPEDFAVPARRAAKTMDDFVGGDA